MFDLTKQERIVLISLGLIILLGSLFKYFIKRYPFLEESVHYLEKNRYFKKIDLNTATIEQLKQIPYIGDKRAEWIVEFRTQQGNFKTAEQLKEVKGIGDTTYEQILPFVKIKLKD